MGNKIRFKAGDIVHVDLGVKPETKGSEQEKPRYCVVIKSAGTLLTVVPCTTTPSDRYYTPFFDNLIKNGIRSYVLCNQIRTVDRERVSKKLNKTLTQEELSVIKEALLSYLGLLP